MAFIEKLFKSLFTTNLPSVRAEQQEEEDLVDPQEKLREKCAKTSKCAALAEKLQTCNDRVHSRTQTAETCVEEVIDYMECVDHCVAPDLFHHLK